MDLYHEAVEMEVEGGLGDTRNPLTTTTDVAGVADEREVGHEAVELHGNFPEGVVAIAEVVVDVESTVDGSYIGQSYLTAAFDGADPEVKVGYGCVLHHHGDGGATQGFGDLLYGEGAAGGAGTNPEGVDAGKKGLLDMVGVGYLAAEFQVGVLLLYSFYPRETFVTDAFESAWHGARFPDAEPDHGDLWQSGEGVDGDGELILALEATGSGDD